MATGPGCNRRAEEEHVERVRNCEDSVLKAELQRAQQLVELAREHRKKGEHQAAEHLLRQASENDPTPRSTIILGTFLIETSFPAEAEKVFSRLLAADPENTDYLVRLAQCMAQQERFAAACRTLGKALEREPLHAEGLRLLAEIGIRTNQTSCVKRHLEKVAGVNTRAPAPFLTLSSIHERENRLEEAARVLGRGLKSCPGDPLLLNALGIINYKKGRYQASVHCYGRALAKIHSRGGGCGPILKHIRMNLANALCMAGRIDDSLHLYEKLLEENPDSETIGINMAITLRHANRLKEARYALENLTRLGRGGPQLFYWLGVVCAEDNLLQQAEQHLRQALSLDGDDPSLKLNLASVLKRLGRPDEALAIVEDALFLYPGGDEAARLRVDILVECNRLGEAAGLCRALLEKNPADAHLLHRLGMIEALMGRLDNAIPCLKRALEADPTSVECRLYLAEILLIDGRIDQCLDLLREGLETKTLARSDISAHPGLDDAKDTAAYRAISNGSILDFADPWGGAEKRLLALFEELPVSSPDARDRCPLWRDLEFQGTFVCDAAAAVRQVLKELAGDFMLAGSLAHSRSDRDIHVEVHPLDAGLEIRTVFHGREKEAAAFTLSLAVFRLSESSYLVRLHAHDVDPFQTA